MKLTHDDRKSDIAKLLRNAATILKQLSVSSQSKRSTPKDVLRDARVVKKLLASARIASGGQYANELSQLENHVDKIAQWPDNSQAGKIAAQLAARIASISGHMTDPWSGDAARATQMSIKQRMNYHAREYRRLKAMDADPMAEIKKHLSDGMAAAKEVGAYESKYRAAQNKMGAALDGLRGIINANKNNPEVLRAANDAYRKITGL